jgi:DegV family protein with EDD domain
MTKIAIVTDSTAYIPADLARALDISIIPQLMIWDERTLQDGIDIQPDEFYRRLRTSRSMPTTAQASVLTMQTIFQDLVERDFDVVGIFISGKLSGTLQSASQARQALAAAAERVTLVDSHTTALALGFIARAAARAARQGAGLRDCVALAEKAREHVGVYFAMDTLEFLHRGGRIGGAQRFFGSALNLKPILALKDGRVEAEDRVRTKHKAVDRVLELVREQVAGRTPLHLASLHADARPEAVALLERAAQELGASESILSSVSPVVGVHAGPGTVGLAFMAGM